MTPEPSNIYLAVQALLVSLVVAIAAGWIGMRLAWRWGLIDHPNSAPHKQHKRPTPLGGGIALFSALLVGVIVIVGALTFFPALSLSPIVEHFLARAGKVF